MPILSSELNITEKTRYTEVLIRLMDTIASGSRKHFSDNFNLVGYCIDCDKISDSYMDSGFEEISEIFTNIKDKDVYCSLILGKLLKIAHESEAYFDAKDIGLVVGTDNSYYIIFSWYTRVDGVYTSLVFNLDLEYTSMTISKVNLHRYQVEEAILSGKYNVNSRIRVGGLLNVFVDEIKYGKYKQNAYDSFVPYTNGEYFTNVFNKHVRS